MEKPSEITYGVYYTAAISKTVENAINSLNTTDFYSICNCLF